MPPLSTSHKRALSSGEVSTSKRPAQDRGPGAQNVHNPAAAPDPRTIYVVVREKRIPYLPSRHDVVEAYATIQDANRGLRSLKSSEWRHEQWERKYDTDGLLTLYAQEEEGEQV